MMGYGTPTIPRGITTQRALAVLLHELGYVFITKAGGHVDLERLPADIESWGGRLDIIEAHEKRTHEFVAETRNELELHRADKHGANTCPFCGRIRSDAEAEKEE